MLLNWLRPVPFGFRNPVYREGFERSAAICPVQKITLLMAIIYASEYQQIDDVHALIMQPTAANVAHSNYFSLWPELRKL